jgi:hypothetical protein
MLTAEQSVVKNEGTGFTPIPEGVYGVEVVDINFKPKEELKPGKFPAKDKYYITLGILDEGELRGKSLVHFVTTAYNAGFTGGQPSKLYDFVCAVMGEKVDDKKELVLPTLIGGQLVIIVKDSPTADGRVFSNITEVMKKGAKIYAPLTDAERTACMPKIDGVPVENVEVPLDLPDLNPSLPEETVKKGEK